VSNVVIFNGIPRRLHPGVSIPAQVVEEGERSPIPASVE
jgi:hypothetical protein